MRKLFTLLFLLVLTNFVSAGVCTNCKIKSIGIGPHYDNLCIKNACAFILVEGNLNDIVPCSTGSWHFVVDTTTDSGKSALSLLLMAHAADKRISIAGDGSCNYSREAETFLYSYLADK
ncbi:hypothetical protein H0A36_26220 [Endozoicomonas sp. SM1973]|uniref:Uncharacterized protein n=1 Tax=Spartinivicinus marinus TaxID=2994442 RepID=A0A853IG51_9GAMM|nr:hypothetical protein [Spartinivicinus marinus]MCX4030494.1 hypothetical protein [Spartinivicinus marinus]NYZ69518.1 hypothetical protein [Spartinivicinus marinus]